MSQTNNNTSSGGVGLSGLIFVALLVLKLTGVINWSWWFVTMPLWIGPAILFAGGIIFLVLSGLFIGANWVYGKIDKKHAEKRREQKKVKAVRNALDAYSKSSTRR